MNATSFIEEAERLLSHLMSAHKWRLTLETLQLTEFRVAVLAIAARAEHRHKLAVISSSAIDQPEISLVEAQNPEVILALSYVNPDDRPKFHTRLITRDDLITLICEWNAAIAVDDVMPDSISPTAEAHREVLYVRAESPLDEIWARLGQFTSVALSRQLLADRRGVSASGVTTEHAEALAYFVRNARDYFSTSIGQSVTQRALSLYYGTMALAEAEIIAHPHGPTSIAEIEGVTRYGHGLASSDSDATSPTLAGLCVLPLRSGFFPKWVAILGHQISTFHQRRPDQAVQPFVTLLDLFARVPELGALFADVSSNSPLFAAGFPASSKNGHHGLFRGDGFTYVDFVDESGRLTIDVVRSFGNLTQIQYAESEHPGRAVRALVRHPNHSYWWDALPIHQSGTVRHTLIAPLWGDIREYRVLCTVLLYALSIVVRYRPSLWRQTQEGELDSLKNLVDAFLRTVQRLIPEHFLAALIGRPILAGASATFIG